MNLNQLAKEIAKREGKKVQVNIAQIKEILRVMNEILIGESYGVVKEMKEKSNRKSKRGGK